MTSERDFDRLARAWLAVGPDEAPDRAIAAVLQAAETVPQVRRRIRRPLWRFPEMNRVPMFATVVVAIAVVVGGGLFLTRSNEPASGVNPATGSPSASPTESDAPPADVPAALRYSWVGPKRVIAGMPSYDRYRFSLDGRRLWFPNDDLTRSVLGSSASVTGPNQLRLVASAALGPPVCATGAVGTYGWDLSSGGVRLTLTAVDDQCPTRALALVGDWTRVACTMSSSGCNGILEAGTFSSQYVGPKVGPGDTWHPDFGAVTYTVPEGWANSSDWPSTFSLTPTGDYALETADGPPPDTYHGIWIFTRPAASLQNAGCTNQEQTQVGHSVSALVDWVRSRPSLVTTAPTPITMGGLSGQWLDIKLATDWRGTCPLPDGSQSPPAALYLSESGNDADGWSISVQGGEQQRLILLDLGGGKTVSIFIDSTYPDRFADLVSEAMPIVQSFKFK